MMVGIRVRAQRAFGRILLLACTAAFATAGPACASVVISTAATQNMSCSGGVCTPTAPKATLNATDLANMLAAGDTKVVADSAAKNIEFKAPLSWTSTSRLTLDSYRSIVFQQPITVAGTGAVTITTNDGGANGDFWFDKTGHLEFWDLQSSLVINATTYKLIGDVRHLANGVAKNPSGSFALAADYDATPDGVYAVTPIGNFGGHFDGLGHAIANFRVNDKNSSYVGLFTGVTTTGSVRHLQLKGIRIVGTASVEAGGVAGVNYGHVSDVLVSGKIIGPQDAGGVTGYNLGTIENATSDVAVKLLDSGYAAGGIAGESKGVIDNSHASGPVTGGFAAYLLGGVIGNNQGQIAHSGASGEISAGTVEGGLAASNSGEISYSFATGNITGNDGSDGGGLVGENTGTISQSFATGAVNDWQNGGGLVGDNYSGQVQASYGTGAVQGETVGGLCGFNSGSYLTISNSYSVGAVSGSRLIGGFAGQDDSDDMAKSYWDLDTSNINDPGMGCGNKRNCQGVTGLTDAQLKSALPDGFDPKVWGQASNINNGYPYLLANPPPK